MDDTRRADPAESANDASLSAEGVAVHRATFGLALAPDPDLIASYVRARTQLGPEAAPTLADRARILVTLAEARPDYYAVLVNTRERRLRAWLSLGVALVRTGVARAQRAFGG